MREIVFRGKRKDNGEWAHGELIQDTILNRNRVSIRERGVAGTFFHTVEPETVGQYTGLKDHNGTKIFEGDVVKFYDSFSCVEIDQVVWGGEYYPAFDLAHEWVESANSLVELVQDEEARLEVLGNIHDNAALLSREYRESLEAECYGQGGLAC